MNGRGFLAEQQRRLEENVFIFYPRMSQLCRSVQYGLYVMTAFLNYKEHEKFAIVVHVLQNMYDFVISRC